MRLLPQLPSLPEFRSLLVHGPYHPSAPIHTCLSIPPSHHAILLSPSRLSLLHALQDDPWLIAHSGTGTAASSSSRVTVFYPPSPTHVVAVLAMLRTHDLASPVAPSVTLDHAPTLLILHEPSVYFLSEQEGYTVSSYLLLITHALSTAEYLSSQSLIPSPTNLVVFDTRLDQLRLPVLQTPLRNTFGERDDSEGDSRPESVLFLVQKYFEFLGTFQLRGLDSTPAFALRRSGDPVVD